MSEKKKILVVEDDKDSKNALCLMLESLGFEHMSFEGGQAALDEIKKNKNNNIDICLLDVMMPGMNGYELLQELKKLDEFKNTPCIMVTAKTEDEDVIEGYKHGVDYYITKPYTREQISFGINICLNPEVQNES
jgi:DNA-binding response OmpR family regulator